MSASSAAQRQDRKIRETYVEKEGHHPHDLAGSGLGSYLEVQGTYNPIISVAYSVAISPLSAQK